MIKHVSAAMFAIAILAACTTTTSTPDTEARAPLAASSRTLDMFREGPDQACYDRATQPSTFVVDTHNHFRPFGGQPRPYEEVLAYLEDSGVLFANIYGIGQSLPFTNSCTYYLDCPGVPATSSIQNDMANAANLATNRPDNLVLTLSATFPDLANPENVNDVLDLYDATYPGLFEWMGEVNLVKQALFGNGHVPATPENIDDWRGFMERLRHFDMPIAIHSDLGSDDDPTEYLALMDYALQRYPHNRIIWVHMGLSRELTTIPANDHIALMSERLDRYPNLMLDITWRVIADNYFDTPENIAAYTAFFNHYYDRILTGTDFVASFNKSFDVYAEEVEVNSMILSELDDRAFRHIALGQTYFDLLGLPYRAPDICTTN
ncbi:amidohydrolase family protein [Ponticaulis koreensis]|uniref:amidohydrolase family protein n=1 Tax=Ponticaulis koreensis TaxID=1123045 RepID=UPI0003B5E80F|nr:amidohydrolase family protein [Ponticaulis koreensis]